MGNGFATKYVRDEKDAANALLEFWRENGVEFYAPIPIPKKQESKPKIAPAAPAPTSLINPNKTIEDSRAIVEKCTNLIELRAALNGFKDFHLVKTAKQMVFCDGIENADIMIIGEAPGGEEDEQGKPFVGPAGKLLDAMLGSVGLSRKSNFYITNVVNWRPPGNRTPSKEEIAICLPFIKKHIELKKPKFVILVGSVSASALLNSKDGITKIRKNTYELAYFDDGKEVKVPCHAIFHPSYLLRRPQEKSWAWIDLLRIKAALKKCGLLGD